MMYSIHYELYTYRAHLRTGANPAEAEDKFVSSPQFCVILNPDFFGRLTFKANLKINHVICNSIVMF